MSGCERGAPETKRRASRLLSMHRITGSRTTLENGIQQLWLSNRRNGIAMLPNGVPLPRIAGAYARPAVARCRSLVGANASASMLRALLGMLVWPLLAVFFHAAAPAHAELNDTLQVIAEETAVYLRPGSGQPEVMRIEQGRELMEFQRIGPGRHEIWGPEFEDETIEIAEGGGEWVQVALFESDTKSGWVRATDVGLDYVREIVANVIDPCFLEVIRMYGLVLELGEEFALVMLKRELLDHWRPALPEIESVVSGRNRTERLAVYNASRDKCVDGILEIM